MGELYYDPYDFEIDDDPYPVWRRMRDEAPLYRNDKYDFWALSRFDDVEAGSRRLADLQLRAGTLLELIKPRREIPPGTILFEDPPLHDAHRALLARSSPRGGSRSSSRRSGPIARGASTPSSEAEASTIADLGSQMPMRVIGMLLGIPEEDQEALRDGIDAGLSLEEGEARAAGDPDARLPDGALPRVHRLAANTRRTT